MLVTASHQAGQDVMVSFDKEALKQISSVSIHPLFSNESNWVMVSIVFKHTESAKRLVSGFKDDFTKTDNVSVKQDMLPGEVYELHQILISGTDRQPILAIHRDEIANAASMDLTLAGSPAPSVQYVNWNSAYAPATISQFGVEADGGIYGGNAWTWAKSTECAGPNTDGEFVFTCTGNTQPQYGFGVRNTEDDSSFVGIICSWGTARTYYNGSPVEVISAWNPTGLNVVSVKRQAVGSDYSPQVTITVNGVVCMVRPDLTRSLPFVPAVRTMGAGPGDGGVSSAERIL